jgi:hypothetical protein
MPLPAGFKVNGSKTTQVGIPVPPKVQRMIEILDALPSDELLTTIEVCAQVGKARGGADLQHPALQNFREKIDNKLFWGSRKSIARLRKKLSEETHDEN